ncbi:UNVERIFIED_CONTAM: hypothetical protein K2H54_068919 [Gekko kuhli]
MSGADEESVSTTTETTATTPVTETPVTTTAPIMAAPITYAPDSQWDLHEQVIYQPMPGEGMGDMSSVWNEPVPRGPDVLAEEQVELDDDEEEDEEDWGPRLAALEKGQWKIQWNLEEVILTIPKMVVRVI